MKSVMKAGILSRFGRKSAVDRAACGGESKAQDPTTRVRWELAKQGVTSPEMSGIVDVLTSLPDYDTATLVDDARRIDRELSGVGRLTEALMDPRVTDLVVNPTGDVWCDRGDGMELYAYREFSVAEVRDLAVGLADRCGTRLDDARPFADGMLSALPRGVAADGLRIHAVLSPPAVGGTSINVRALRQSAWSLDELATAGLCPGQVAEFLRACVGKRKNVLVTGGTGTGKTTLLASLMDLVDPAQRIVVVEDTPELMLAHRNLVKLVTRKDNADGRGGVDMQQLVKQCLRMRPDRIVVGEVRGAEIADLLVAFNTGHAGSTGTLHANSAQAVAGRLMALGAMAGMSAEAIAQQVSDGVDYVLHLERADGVRRLAQIGRLCSSAGQLAVEMVWDRGPALHWAPCCEELGLAVVGDCA